MLQKAKRLLAISTLLLLVSCFKDKGNYNYKSIDEVAIKFDKKAYTVFFDRKLEIKPQVSKVKNEADRFTYKWFTYVAGGKGKGIKEEQVLSTTKDLTIEKVRLKPSTYQVYLYIKDKKTGIEWQNNTQLEVTTLNYEGWLVLNEVNGNSRLDMITLSEGRYTTRHNILNIVGSSLVLKGMPKFVVFYPYDNTTRRVCISTSGNGTTRVEPDTFDWKKTYNISYDFISKQPLNLEVDALNVGDKQAYIVNKGNLYYYRQGRPFSVPYNRVDGEKFKVSKLVTGGSVSNTPVVYDDTHKRFLQTDRNANQSCRVISANEEKFKWETGKDLIYIEKNDYNRGRGAETFAILKGTSNNYFLAQFSRSRGFAQKYYGKITATDFDKATAYAFSPEYQYLFYVVGSKVYQYDFSKDIATTKLMLDKGSNKITLLKFHDFFFRTGIGYRYAALQNELIVGSYDPSKPAGSNGTMELYKVPSAHGQITLDQSYTGFGKIKSVSYRER